MDPRATLSAFLLVLLAELGDKTQIATMLLAARTRSPWSVFLGASCALVMTSLLGVLMGVAVARVIPASYLRWAAGLGFMAVGLLLLLRA